MQYLYFSSCTLTLFIIALIVGKPTRVVADYIFLGWLLLILANLATFFMLSVRGLPSQKWEKALVLLSDVSLFLHGPFFWLYTCSLTRPFFRLSARDALHLLPFAAGLVYWLLAGRRNSMAGLSDEILLLIKLLLLLSYTIAVIRQLKRYRNKITHIFSNTEEKYLGWLRFLSWGLLVLGIAAFGSAAAAIYTSRTLPIAANNFLHFSTSLFIAAVCYFAIRQTPIVYARISPPDFSETGISEEAITVVDVGSSPEGGSPEEGADGKKVDESRGSKYRKSGLNAGATAKMYTRLLEVMEAEKPHLDADLTLYSLAAILNWAPNHLSQVINTHEGKNFFDFVNRYRIEAVKKNIRSRQYEHLTLLSIAYECGFNSKAAFNRAFKKMTGQTPSGYRREDL